MRRFLITVCAASLAACATGRPVLSPNAMLDLGGRDDANRAINECLGEALQAGAHDPAGEVITYTLGGALRGAVDGAIIGSYSGHARDGARLGAALGAAQGMFHGLAHANHPDDVAQVYVERCLAASGYEVLGWK